MGDVNARPAEQFLEALKRRNLQGKKALIADLRHRKTDKAIEILIDVLQDDSWYLRELAVEALGESGETAVPRLVELLDSGLWYTRAAAARTLGKIGHLPSLGLLVRLLGDPNKTVQGASLASIADIVRGGHAREVARALWALGPDQAEDLKRLLVSVHPEPGAVVAELLADPGALIRDAGPPRSAEEGGDEALAPRSEDSVQGSE
jgi:HEAT repeat protein